MCENWPTRTEDLNLARTVIGVYAGTKDTLGIVECFFDPAQKKLDLTLASWVMMLAKKYIKQYGFEQGEIITRRVISHCIVEGETLH